MNNQPAKKESQTKSKLKKPYISPQVKQDNGFDDYFLEKHQVTDDLVEYYRQNPEELDLIIDQEHFDNGFLGYFFIVGFVLTVVVRIVAFFFEGSFGEFFNKVVLDLISELGIAIFGGAVTAYLLGSLQKKQYRENVRFRNAIKDRIEQSTQSEPDNDKAT